MNPAAAGVGGKRPAPPGGEYVPRKRPAGDDDDVMEEDFDLEPPEDDLEEYMPEEVRAWGCSWQRSRCCPARGTSSVGGEASLQILSACPSHPMVTPHVPPASPDVAVAPRWKNWMRPAPPPLDPARDTLGAAGGRREGPFPAMMPLLEPTLFTHRPLRLHHDCCLLIHPRILLTCARLPALSLPSAPVPASSVPAAGGRLRLLRTPSPVLPHRPQGRAGGAPVWRDGAWQQRLRLCARLRALLLRRGALALLLARRLPGADRGAECEGRRAVWC